MQGINELKRVQAELPAGSLETFVRLATYAEELYEEDHGGRLIAPGLSRGDARIDVRRKLAPRQYELAVSAPCGRYLARVEINEFPPPDHHHGVSFYLRKR